MTTGGLVGSIAGCVAVMTEMAILGAFLGWIGESPRDTIIGAALGLIAGVTLAQPGGQGDLVSHAGIGMIVGASDGATSAPFGRGDPFPASQPDSGGGTGSLKPCFT